MIPDGTTATPLRWGVLGAARINGKVVPSIRAGGDDVVLLGASSLGRAEDAARTLGVPRAVEGYAAVVADPDVEAVYLPLANHQHREWLLAAAAAGKHCLCEKPMVLAAADALEIQGAFRAAGRRVMEGFMWRHHPQVARAREHFVPGRLGDVRRFHATFSFALDRPEDYRWVRSMGGGALLDIGGYCVNAARFFFRGEPTAVSVRAGFRPGDEGVDESAAGWLDFGDGRLATFSVSFASGFSQGIEVVGAEGRARIGRPWNAMEKPALLELDRGYDHDQEEIAPADPYRLMAEHFTALARDPAMPMGLAEDGVAQARVLDAMLASARADGAIVAVA